MDPAIVVFGLGVGLLVGMTGIGGGSLMTPLLILVFGVKPITAVGTDLAYGAVTKTVGGFKHLRQGTVDMTLSGWMAVGSVPSAIGGVYVLDRSSDRRARTSTTSCWRSWDRAAVLRRDDAGAGAVPEAPPRPRARQRGDGAAPQGLRGRSRRVRRLRPRRDLGRQRRADRRRTDPAVPPRAHAGGGHRRLPRGHPAVGRSRGAHRRRQRGLRIGRQDPPRLRSRRVGGKPPLCAGPDRCAAHDAGRGAARLRPRSVGEGRGRHPRPGARRRAGDRGGARGLEHVPRSARKVGPDAGARGHCSEQSTPRGAAARRARPAPDSHRPVPSPPHVLEGPGRKPR